MKTVSIIIPVYNVENYIDQCLKTVINQTYEDIELIIVNDGSTDNSASICSQYAESDKRIVLINQSNKGAAIAKNAGLSKCSGDYITFLDSDDYVEKNWIEKMVYHLEKNKADLVECCFYMEYVNDSQKSGVIIDREYTSEEYLGQFFQDWSTSLFWNKLFKKEITAGIQFKNERRCIDDEFYTYKLLCNAEKIVRISDCLYHYRQRRSGVMRSPSNNLQRTLDALNILTERYDYVTSRYPALTDYYLDHDVNILPYFSRSFAFNSMSRKEMKNKILFYFFELIKRKKTVNSYKPLVKTMIKVLKGDLKKQIDSSNSDLDNLFP